MKRYPFLYLAVLTLAYCSPSASIKKTAVSTLLKNDLLGSAHTGIAVYDAGSGKSLYNYQSDKYFVPASNTKLFTLYAGMKYLGDSLPGIRYRETADSIILYPTGDPTLLHPGFRNQPVIQKLKASVKKTIAIDTSPWQEEAFGKGWAWDDYNDSYMPERSALPVYGNVIKWIQSAQSDTTSDPGENRQMFIFSEPEVDWPVRFVEDRSVKSFRVKRDKEENLFRVHEGTETYKEQDVPFITNGVQSAAALLKDTVGKELVTIAGSPIIAGSPQHGLITLHSQPADSLFRLMMHRSDNLFAEQTLLMAAGQLTGTLNCETIIDTLLATDLKNLPQPPHWVDGSGLSRYNLFTPADFVWILDKMKREFGMERLKRIFPTGGQGSLQPYFRQDSGYIYAKTGTLSGQLALSGFLITARKRLLIFSVLINNHPGSAAAIRRATEDFLTEIRKRL